VVEITERREVRVRAEAGTFVFAAEPEAGRLVICEQRDDGDEKELCALTIADRHELSGFLQGLRRVLGVEEERTSPVATGPTARAKGSGSRGIEEEPADSGTRSALPAPPGQDERHGGPGAPGGGHREEDDRRDAMERARARGQSKAFAPWSRDEEQQLLEAVEAGRDLDELARVHQRSRRALELRLERLRK
jgi:hypothetical protein